MRFLAPNAPAHLESLLAGAPELRQLARTAPFDCALAFATSERAARAHFAKLAPKLGDTGMIWMAWPKKAGGGSGELDSEAVRRAGLEAGLVDVKVCAIDARWSALKFVRRVRDRKR